MSFIITCPYLILSRIYLWEWVCSWNWWWIVSFTSYINICSKISYLLVPWTGQSTGWRRLVPWVPWDRAWAHQQQSLYHLHQLHQQEGLLLSQMLHGSCLSQPWIFIYSHWSLYQSNHTFDPDTLKMPWWWRPYRLMTLTQLFTIKGMSCLNASRYSSRAPPNSLGCPTGMVLPILLLVTVAG